MEKAIVIGCPGSGKSTFSRLLMKKTSLPLFHLDMLQWKEDRTTVSGEVFQERLDDILNTNQWIIDGNYLSTMEERMRESDTIFFLDYPLETCLSGVRERIGKKRSDMPWVEVSEDAEFMAFIKNFNVDTRPVIQELLEKYSYKRVIIFKDRKQADQFLEGIV